LDEVVHERLACGRVLGLDHGISTDRAKVGSDPGKSFPEADSDEAHDLA